MSTRSRRTASSAKRVLYVVNVGWFFVSHRLVLAEAARDAGYEVHVATTITDDAERAAIGAAGLVLHEVNFDRSGFRPMGELRTIRALLALYRNVRPDLIHHVTVKPILYGGLVARFARMPAVVNAIPGLGYSFAGTSLGAKVRRALIMRGYRFALNHPNSRVIFQNVEHQQMFSDSGVLRHTNAVLVRGSGVNIQHFTVQPEPGGPPTVLLAARMLREKGIFEFVAAAQRLRQKYASLRLLLVGEVDADNPGSITATQLQQWQELGAIEWLGFRSDIAGLLAKCHVACLPTYGEGLPKFLLEAAACGRAIVTTDIPGCRDIARNGLNALLVPPKDAIALEAALERLLRDPDMRRRFGAAGRALVEAEFSEEHVVTQTLQIYRGLLSA